MISGKITKNLDRVLFCTCNISGRGWILPRGEQEELGCRTRATTSDGRGMARVREGRGAEALPQQQLAKHPSNARRTPEMVKLGDLGIDGIGAEKLQPQ